MSNRTFYCIDCQKQFDYTPMKEHMMFNHGVNRMMGSKELVIHMNIPSPEPDKYIWRWDMKKIKVLEFVELTIKEAIEIGKEMGLKFDLTTGEYKE